jgi:hypothetical protein
MGHALVMSMLVPGLAEWTAFLAAPLSEGGGV